MIDARTQRAHGSIPTGLARTIIKIPKISAPQSLYVTHIQSSMAFTFPIHLRTSNLLDNLYTFLPSRYELGQSLKLYGHTFF